MDRPTGPQSGLSLVESEQVCQQRNRRNHARAEYDDERDGGEYFFLLCVHHSVDGRDGCCTENGEPARDQEPLLPLKAEQSSDEHHPADAEHDDRDDNDDHADAQRGDVTEHQLQS